MTATYQDKLIQSALDLHMIDTVDDLPEDLTELDGVLIEMHEDMGIDVDELYR